MREISVGNNLTAATKTTVYTVPTGYYARWNLCYIVNYSGNNKSVTVKWYDKTTNTEYFILDSYVLTHTNFVRFDGGAYVVLEEGDQVYITTEAGSTMSATNTFELYRKP